MSNVIKAIRALRGYTQEETATTLGITGRTYCRKEANPDTFTLLEAKKLAKLFEVDVSNFFKDELTLSVSNQ